MSSYEQKGAVSGADLSAREYGLGGSIFARYAKRNRGLLTALNLDLPSGSRTAF
jgi:hypothetical protein